MPMRTLLVLATLFTSATALAVPCPDELPTLLVVQDKSGSMAGVPDANCPTCPTKWASSKTAVTTLAAQFANRFRFGMQMYPRDATTFNCIAGTILSPVPASSTQLSAAFGANAPGGGTPTASSLDAARAYLNTLGITSESPAYVLLLTDGLPNCNDANAALCSQCRADAAQCSAGCRPTEEPGTCDVVPFDGAACLDEENLVAAVRQLRSQGIVTFVIGFGRDTASSDASGVLNRAAVEGGHPRLGAAESYYQANSVEELKGFLEELLVEFPCTYELDPPPSERDLLSVNLRDGKAGRPDLADRILVEGTEWEFASGALDAVRLIGPVCDLVQNAEFGRYEVQIIYAEPL